MDMNGKDLRTMTEEEVTTFVDHLTKEITLENCLIYIDAVRQAVLRDIPLIPVEENQPKVALAIMYCMSGAIKAIGKSVNFDNLMSVASAFKDIGKIKNENGIETGDAIRLYCQMNFKAVDQDVE